MPIVASSALSQAGSTKNTMDAASVALISAIAQILVRQGNRPVLLPLADQRAERGIREQPVVSALRSARIARGGEQQERCRRQHRDDDPDDPEHDEQRAEDQEHGAHEARAPGGRRSAGGVGSRLARDGWRRIGHDARCYRAIGESGWPAAQCMEARPGRMELP